ncbi:MAG: hypothetical protein ACYDHF_06245 [Candidatus Cryosericum sp.]
MTDLLAAHPWLTLGAGIFLGCLAGIIIIGLLQMIREPSMPEPPENTNFVSLKDLGPED